jgi:HAD superfamily hydrolase (TIGR01549 family)
MQKIFASYKIFIFDLDNTLYNEKDYLFEGYRFIAEYVSSHSNYKQDEIFSYLRNEFILNGHKHLFDKLNQKFILNIGLDHYLHILRKFKTPVKFQLFPEMLDLLQNLQNGNKIVYIATNGNRIQQENKISSIDWGGLINGINIVYCNDFEPKPSPVSLQHIIAVEKVTPEDVVFIGDSDTDKIAAEGAGIDFIFSNNLNHAG